MRQNLTNIPTVDINNVDHLYIVGSTTKSGLLEGRSNVKVDLKAAIGEGGSGSAELSEALLNRIIYSGIADAVLSSTPKENVLILKDDFLSGWEQAPEEIKNKFEVLGPEDFYGVVSSGDSDRGGIVVRLSEEDYNLWSQYFDELLNRALPPMPLCFPITDEIIIEGSGTFYIKDGGLYIHKLRNRNRVIDNVTENNSILDIGHLVPILGTTDSKLSSMVGPTVEETMSWEEFITFFSNYPAIVKSIDFPLAIPAQYSTTGISSEERTAIRSAFDSKKDDYEITVAKSTLLPTDDFFVSMYIQGTEFITIIKILSGNMA